MQILLFGSGLKPPEHLFILPPDWNFARVLTGSLAFTNLVSYTPTTLVVGSDSDQ